MWLINAGLMTVLKIACCQPSFPSQCVFNNSVSFIYRLPLKTSSALHYWTNIAENNVTRIATRASRPEMIHAKPTSIPPPVLPHLC